MNIPIETNRLEIQHLAPYWPYGLTFYVQDCESGEYEILPVTYIDFTNEQIEIGGTTFDWSDIGRQVNGIVCKPVLHPLSDLTREIEHNGERFVPIVELARIDSDLLPNHYEVLNHDWSTVAHGTEVMQYSIQYITKTGNYGNLTYEFSYWEKLKRFSKKDLTRDMPLGVSRQLDMFKKLYEWHFDLENLIPAGLAIDINTLNKEVGNDK